MASKFSSIAVCEGDFCVEITDVTYYVKEKKLCKDCASKEGCTVKASTGEQNLVCEEHDEKIKRYCKTHGVYLCNTWAMIHHDKCVLQDIVGAKDEIKVKLKGLKGKAKYKKKSCQAYGVKILQCRKDSDNHLQAIKYEVDKAIQEAMDVDHDREQEDAAKINKEIDEKNQKLQQKIQTLQEEIDEMNYDILENNEEREKKLAMNHTNGEIRRKPLKEKQYDLLMHIQSIAEEIEKKIGELEKSWKNNTKATEDAIHKLETVLEDDENVVKDGHRVTTSVADELKKPLDEGWVTHISQAVLGVRFVKGVGRKKYNGRIDGYDGEWRLIDTINIPDEINYPFIVGCIDESNVIITDALLGACHTYMLDMNTTQTQRVITSSEEPYVTSCASLNDDMIVCGKHRKVCTGDSLTGYISVYDRQWKLIHDLIIPRNTARLDTRVCVAADRDGMIIAAEEGQSKIYVINSADGKIIKTITCQENISLLEGASTDHIISRPQLRDRRVLMIDRRGTQREIPFSTRNKSDVIWNVCIDPLIDDLYVMTSDNYTREYVIDQVMSGGGMTKRRVAVFPSSTRHRKSSSSGYHGLRASRVVMTPSGKMIVFDGNNILVFKKIFSL